MIAVSDAVLITVSAVALVSGVVRWQDNVEQATRLQQPAVVAPEAQQPINNGGSNILPSSAARSDLEDNVEAVNRGNTEPAPESSQPRVVVVEPTETVLIDTTEDSQTQRDNQATVDAVVYGNYTVQSGDSLSVIAERFNTSVQTLQLINQISGSRIDVGQQIRYPEPVN